MLIETKAIESPCQLICTLDLEKGLCKGCGRSRAEIAGWTRYSPEQRRAIMRQLPGRLQTLTS